MVNSQENLNRIFELECNFNRLKQVLYIQI